MLFLFIKTLQYSEQGAEQTIKGSYKISFSIIKKYEEGRIGKQWINIVKYLVVLVAINIKAYRFKRPLDKPTAFQTCYNYY